MPLGKFEVIATPVSERGQARNPIDARTLFETDQARVRLRRIARVMTALSSLREDAAQEVHQPGNSLGHAAGPEAGDTPRLGRAVYGYGQPDQDVDRQDRREAAYEDTPAAQGEARSEYH
jgi:hypothetical protein